MKNKKLLNRLMEGDRQTLQKIGEILNLDLGLEPPIYIKGSNYELKKRIIEALDFIIL